MNRAVSAVVAPVLIAFATFATIEVALRLFAPQDTVALEDMPAGLPDAEIGYVLRPNFRFGVRCPEYDVQYSTNAQGFRAQSDYRDSAVAGTTRILVVGDSFTFGQGVPEDRVWTQVVGETMRGAGLDVEMLNAGVPGYDTRAELASLIRLAPRFEPDIVVVAFLPNDLYTNLPIGIDTTGQGHAYGVVGRGRPHAGLSLHTVTLAKRLLMLSDRLYRALYSLTARQQYYLQPPTEHVRQQDEVTRMLLDSAATVATNAGARFVVVSIPQVYQVLCVAGGNAADGVDPIWIDREYANHARESGYTWISTLDTIATDYRTRQDDLYYRLDGHLNERGNQVVGEYVARQLRAFMPAMANAFVK